jgi:hypothetical protein
MYLHILEMKNLKLINIKREYQVAVSLGEKRKSKPVLSPAYHSAPYALLPLLLPAPILCAAL